jgi:hypothetical protein
MEVFDLSYSEIPDGFCVIRIKKSNSYLHINNGVLYFYEKMNGCFVFNKELADDIISDVEQVTKKDVEIVDFKEAYNQHGIIEKQIKYN